MGVDELLRAQGPRKYDHDYLLDSIYNHIAETFSPTDKPDGKTEYFTSQEVWDMIGTIYPEPPISPNDVAQWLQRNGYRFVQVGNNKICWLLKKH